MAHDHIHVPPPQAYAEPINWHRTALHELGHWTGAAGRLGRDLSGSFGSKKYSQEELVAEMASAFLCASLDIAPTVRHADYIGNWLQVLRADDRAILRAASAASKAADYLLAFRPRLGRPTPPMRGGPLGRGGRLMSRTAPTTPSISPRRSRPKGPPLHRALRSDYLHHSQCRRSGFDPDFMKAACAAAGLPVIDTRAATSSRLRGDDWRTHGRRRLFA